jgi:hypothetical protein
MHDTITLSKRPETRSRILVVLQILICPFTFCVKRNPNKTAKDMEYSNVPIMINETPTQSNDIFANNLYGSSSTPPTTSEIKKKMEEDHERSTRSIIITKSDVEKATEEIDKKTDEKQQEHMTALEKSLI